MATLQETTATLKAALTPTTSGERHTLVLRFKDEDAATAWTLGLIRCDACWDNGCDQCNGRLHPLRMLCGDHAWSGPHDVGRDVVLYVNPGREGVLCQILAWHWPEGATLHPHAPQPWPVPYAHDRLGVWAPDLPVLP
jgi:hypothetical protein